MKYFFFLLLIVNSLTANQEVSVYGKQNTSYNNQNINGLRFELEKMNQLVNSLNNRLSGLESTYEGDSQKLNATVNKVSELIQSNNIPSNADSNVFVQDEVGLVALKEVVAKLTELVNKINSEYISSTEFKNNMQQFITRDEFEALKKALNLNISNASNPNDAKKSSGKKSDENPLKTSSQRSEYMAEAKKNYESKLYNLAIEKFERLINVKYKPAENNFYLGEIWFKRKNYDTAIIHFKRSAVLNDKASYMPILLLHSAISFENMKDKENAINFYSTLIELYPKSSEAKDAKLRLNKIQ